MKLPREHGLIMIWTSTVLLGITQSLFNLHSLLGLFIGIIFCLSIFLSYTSVNLLLDSKFTEIDYGTLSFLIITSIITFFWDFDSISLFFFGILGLLVLIWAGHSYYIGGRLSYFRTVVGTMAISLQFPILYHLGAGISDKSEFMWLFAMWWMYFGVTLILILSVGNYREKIPRCTTILVWSLFLFLTLPFFFNGVLHYTALIFLIDPTLRSFYHLIFNPTLKKNRINIRRVGYNLTFSTFFFLLLSIFFSISGAFHFIHTEKIT